MRDRPGRACGFTLLEVLVALAVTALAIAALWKALSQGMVVAQGLPERSAARWVAHNRIVLRQAAGEWPAPRAYQGSAEMGGREWHWEEQVSATQEPRLRRLTVKVGRTPKALSLVTLEGFLRQPARPAPQEQAQ